ncbi:MAG: response regulator [Planctomycetes bacterium]|nr:response regulator [Planctomycetota bacterium]
MTEENDDHKIEGAIRKVLVVDDDPEIRDLLYRVLTKENYQVATMPSGSAALEYLKNQRPDIILLDQRMPGMDGLETLKQIREFDKDLPTIMLTGYGTADLEIAALKMGMSDFLRKGSSAPKLLKTMDEVIKKQKAIQAGKQPKQGGGNIIIVDDEAEIRQLMEKFLLRQGYTVRNARSGEEALEILKKGEFKPDLILMDIKLTGMDGLVTLKEIKKLNNALGVIVVSGELAPQIKQQALELGALDYIYKPVDLELLHLTIRIRASEAQSNRVNS